MEKLWFGDWFILMQLSKNMNTLVFDHIVHQLAEEWSPHPSSPLQDIHTTPGVGTSQEES